MYTKTSHFRLARFDNDRTISFIPPDGEFELMSYRLNTAVKPLIWIESEIETHSHSRVEIMVKAKSQFKRRSTANNVEIICPVPNDADSPKFKTSIGTCRYVPEKSSVVWSIKSFPGGKVSLHFLYDAFEANLTSVSGGQLPKFLKDKNASSFPRLNVPEVFQQD